MIEEQIRGRKEDIASRMGCLIIGFDSITSLNIGDGNFRSGKVQTIQFFERLF